MDFTLHIQSYYMSSENLEFSAQVISIIFIVLFSCSKKQLFESYLCFTEKNNSIRVWNNTRVSKWLNIYFLPELLLQIWCLRV